MAFLENSSLLRRLISIPLDNEWKSRIVHGEATEYVSHNRYILLINKRGGRTFPIFLNIAAKREEGIEDMELVPLSPTRKLHMHLCLCYE